MKLGVWDRSMANWTSGSEYTRAQAAVLTSVQVELGFDLEIVARTTKTQLSVANKTVPVTQMPDYERASFARRQLDRVARAARVTRGAQMRAWDKWIAEKRFDVLLSFSPSWWWEPSDVATCMWIWDLQHRDLPHLFSDARLSDLDTMFRRDGELGDLVIVSSEASRRDFQKFAPDLAHKVRVYRFPSRFAFDAALSADTELDGVLRKYGIENDFFLVVNQFWRHKNHEAVVEAAAILKQRTGWCPQIVMIGNPYDDRDPSGSYLSNLLTRIAECGLEGRVKILGFVSGSERDALFRQCKALIQPSRFEGWNTSIEDAKAIGRPVVASDLAVHREQLDDAVGFFELDDASGLAGLLDSARDLPPGPDFDAERTALGIAGAALPETGRQLYSYCVEAAQLATARGAALACDR